LLDFLQENGDSWVLRSVNKKNSHDFLAVHQRVTSCGRNR
jgi:hypothetical protein